MKLRDRIKADAKKYRLTQADLLDKALRELEHAEFIRAVEATPWEVDEEAKEWDDADLVDDIDA
jgi:hypothetical protein